MHAKLRFVPFRFRALCIPDIPQKHVYLLLMVEFCYTVLAYSAAAVQLQRNSAEQRNDVSRRFKLTKKLLEIHRCQFHSGSIPGTHFAIDEVNLRIWKDGLVLGHMF